MTRHDSLRPPSTADPPGVDVSRSAPFEQLVQLVHAPVGGSCLPLDQLIGLLQPPVGVLHTARNLLLHCGDLAENLPDLLRVRGFAVSVLHYRHDQPWHSRLYGS